MMDQKPVTDGVDLAAVEQIFLDVTGERARQEQLRAAGKFSHTCATDGITDNTCLRVLLEELDEALDEANTAESTRVAASRLVRFLNDKLGNDENVKPGDRRALRKELIETIAVGVAWIERLDRHQRIEAERTASAVAELVERRPGVRSLAT